VLDGHQRLKALRLNGETTTTVLVRYDLARADRHAVERVFLMFNTERQQRDRLLQARAALRLFELEKDCSRGELKPWDAPEARDRVGKITGMSGRNLNRYFRVLRTPIEVQNAFRAGNLPLVTAEKVADLPPKEQKTVADRIRGGEDPVQVVVPFLPKPKPRNAVKRVFRGLLSALAQAQAEIAPGLPEMKACLLDSDLEELRRGRKLLDDLIARVQHNRKQTGPGSGRRPS
jgi:hypothetical protein